MTQEPESKPQATPETPEQPKALQKQFAADMPVQLSGGLMPRTYAELIDFAKMIAFSGMVPKNYQGQAGAVLVAFQMGAELGLTPMAAVRSIAVINGRPTVWGDAQLALVKSHPECEDVIEDDLADIRKNQKATCIVKRRGRHPVTRTFSIEDAKEAKLWGKQGPWSQYWPRMMQMRARGFALRDSFADVLTGVVSTEEALDFGDVDMGRADFVEASRTVDPATAIPPAGTTHFGGKRPNGEVSREAPGEAAQATQTEPPVEDVAPAPADTAPAKNGAPDPHQEPVEEEESPPPTQAELEAAGQQSLLGDKPKRRF
jgi:hypothetical protein